MKKLFTIFLSINTFHCFAQTETKEDFVNQVYHRFFDRTYKCYNIFSYTDPVFPKNDEFKDLEKMIRMQFKNIIPEYVLGKLIAKAALDTVSEEWDCARLQNANCTNDESVDKYCTEMYWTRAKEISKLEHLEPRYEDKWEEQKLQLLYDDVNNLPIEEKHKFVFSKPVFSDDYAILSLRIYALDEFLEYCFLFRKMEGKWIIQIEKVFNGWLIQR